MLRYVILLYVTYRDQHRVHVIHYDIKYTNSNLKVVYYTLEVMMY
jgi:hypothetical protein